MPRCSRSWCWGVAVLMLLGPTGKAVYASDPVVLNCYEPTRRPWKIKSPSGRFTLSQAVEKGRDSAPDLYVLGLKRGATPVWSFILKDPPDTRQVWIAPEGGYVLLLRNGDELTLIGPAGQELGKWALRDHFSEGERGWVPWDPFCRTLQWAMQPRFEGDSFVVEVPTGLVSSGDPAASRRTTVRILLKEAKLTREGERLGQTDVELIQAFEAAVAPEVRLRLADELLGRSQLKERVKGKELQAFWTKLVQAAEVSPKALHRMAVEAIGAIGPEAEIRALARLPGTAEVRDLAVLELLIRRLPDAAEDHALRMLEGRHPALSVRRRALEFLLRRFGATRERAEEFALREENIEVRLVALLSLTRDPLTEPRFQHALTFCEDSLPYVRNKVARFVITSLGSAREPLRQRLVEVLRRSGLQREMTGCPEVLLILGALADQVGERTQALEAYTRGLRALERVPDDIQLYSAELRLEATLQLALEAEKNGERAMAERHARQVLKAPSPRTPVCAPQPSRVAMPRIPAICMPPREAAQVARELLGRLKSRSSGGSAP